MLSNLAFIILIAFLFSEILERSGIPGFLGMILAGLLAGPAGNNILPDFIYKNISIPASFLDSSAELKDIAFIILLIRVGFSLNKSDLIKNKNCIIKLSFFPFITEVCVISCLSFYFLNFTFFEAVMTGLIVTSVSPAVIVPSMLELKRKDPAGKVPAIILAGATLENILVIALFGVVTNIFLLRNSMPLLFIAKIPLSFFTGILAGVIAGYLLLIFFKKYNPRDTKKAIIFLISSVLIYNLKKILPIESLLGIIVMGFIIQQKSPELSEKLALKFNKMWVLAELVLFILIGTQIKTGQSIHNFILPALIIIMAGLTGKLIMAYVSLAGTELNKKERLFGMISFIPKASVQAALGSVPLTLQMPHAHIILIISVISIFVTAPIGAYMIKIFSGQNKGPVRNGYL